MDLGIDGRVALVMGASRGLGRASAAALAREGAKVAITARKADEVEAAAAEVGATPFVADNLDLDVLPALVGEVASTLGPIDILVTNTGGPPRGEALEADREQWQDAYRTLVLAPLTLIEAVVPSMQQRKWGRVVNITSLSTREPIEGLMLSNSHRAAAVGMFKTLSRNYAKDGILFNSVAPGQIATDRLAEITGQTPEQMRESEQPHIPVGRFGIPEEFGDAVAFMCSDRASYMTGVSLMVDGGLGRSV